MKKYHSLDDEEELDFWLYGLKTINISDYLFLFKFNQNFYFRFSRVKDLEIYRKDSFLNFIQYHFWDNITQIDYTLIENLSLPSLNQSTNANLFGEDYIQEFLIKKYKGFNFILKTNQALSKEFLLHLSADFNLLAVQEIDMQEVTQIQKFIA